MMADLSPLFKNGVQQGRTQMKVEALTFLQEKYMSKEVERGSAEGEAILKVVRELSTHLDGLK